MAPCRDNPQAQRKYLTPCSPGDEGAIEKSWMDVSTDELLEPELTVHDFVKSVRSGKSSVNEDDIAQYTKWTTEFGQEG